MKDMISVIMPVYNVAQYLPQSIESVLNQDYRNLELILIDDGSKDASGEICDRYARSDSRVRVIHQKNGGAAAAKNAGLRAASGEYLSFVDSDDYLQPNVYEYMVRTLLDCGADVVQFAFQDVYTDRVEPQIQHPGRTELDGKDYLVRLTKDWSCSLLWNKLYKRKLYDGVFFEEGHKVDDEYFTYQGFLNPCKVVLDDTIIYNYRKRASSVMSTPEAAEQRVYDCLDSVIRRREKVIARYPDLKAVFDEEYINAIWYLSGNIGNTEQSIRWLKAHLKQYFRTKGNRFPPRYLWGLLLKMHLSSTEKLLAYCQRQRSLQSTQGYFE